ncbi:uncharacterized protein LOC124290004 isoform X2 [Haliotis rubra]|nr:uncharacterized protein LOC124290004 isoform X2 [Haliotis rubra]
MSHSHSHRPYGKTGTGYYGDNMAHECISLLNSDRETFFRLLDTLPVDPITRHVTIGDYGSADGATSMGFIRDIILFLRTKHGQDVSVTVIYEDQAINDFNSLFSRLHGLKPDRKGCCLQDLGNVYLFATGTSFFEHCVKSETMDIILCLMGVHFLSQEMVPFKDSLSHFPDATKEEAEMARKRAEEDWNRFLLIRAKELRHGGIMLVTASAMMKEGSQQENDYNSYEDLHRQMTQIWRYFRNAGKITQKEYELATLNVYFRNLDDFVGETNNIKSDVYKAGLRMMSVDVRRHESVFLSQWRQLKDLYSADHRKAFAQAFVRAQKCWIHTVLEVALAARKESEREDIIDNFYNSLESFLVEADLENIKLDIVVGHCLFTKTN